MPIVSCLDLPAQDFPLVAELVRADTRETVWTRTVERPCLLDVPCFGGSGFIVVARITYPWGVMEEVL